METAQSHVTNAPNKKGKLSRRKQKLIAGIIGAALLIAIVLLSGWFLNRSSTAATIDGNKYQAVFFTNGQVYFGKLKQVNSSYFKLTDVFYIQAQEAEAKEADSENPQQTSTNSTDIRLIKLGSEVHGPDDEMIISKDQILFFENLKKDGKVSDSIVKYNAKSKQQ
jgi:hypothetical protein